MPQTEMQVLKGIGVSDGIAIGRAVVIETRGPEVFRLSTTIYAWYEGIER